VQVVHLDATSGGRDDVAAIAGSDPVRLAVGAGEEACRLSAPESTERGEDRG
jgi:hypothetical protein